MLVPLKDQLLLFWNKQTKAQRITLTALTLTGLILIPMLVLWASRPSYSVAYHGLSEADAGQIVQKLDDSKIPYTLQENGTILVPSDQVYQVRLKMANAGLPQASSVGFELFSGNTLGMTEFTQKVNYQRALEGELERTIQSLSAVESVRVHLVSPEKTLLVEQQDPTTASITIKQKLGQSLDTGQVRAITNLVASSVEGLKPENVVIVDTEGNMLTSIGGDGTEVTSNQTDNQRTAETAASAEIKKRVQAMMDKVLGPNKYAVQASVLMDWNQKEVTSSVFDPTPSAVRSSHQIDENYTTNGQAIGGVPGAASNLPTPVATLDAQSGTLFYKRSESTLNYELSQTQTKETISPGQVKQVSVSVMVDNITDPAQLASIKQAAAAAAGIIPGRGDTIVVESMKFDTSYYDTQAAEITKSDTMNQYIQEGLIGAAVLLCMILLFIFFSSLKRMRQNSVESWKPVFKPVGELALEAGMNFSLPGEKTDSTPMLASKHEQTAEAHTEQPVRMMSRQYEEDDQRSKVIQRLSEDDPATVAEIIQIWLSSDERKNG